MENKLIIQIAGIVDRHEAEMVLKAGATHLGFPLRLDVHNEDLSETEAAAIIKNFPDPAAAVLITYLNDPEEILGLVDFLACGTVQLHGDISHKQLKLLRLSAPELKIWKSLVIRKDNLSELEQTLRQTESLVDAFITDTWDPETGASGATGKTHDWDVSQKLTGMTPKPVILAGGLNPGNVAEAIKTVKPAGVDAHTGLEMENGRKDPELVRKFIENAKEAFGLYS